MGSDCGDRETAGHPGPLGRDQGALDAGALDAGALDAASFEALRRGAVTVVGRLADASNGVLLVRVDGLGEVARAEAARSGYAVYKPIRAERPLWDFPDGTLADREVAACLIDRAGGWGVVPATVLREGPSGPGSLQRWIGPPPLGVPLDPDALEDPDARRASRPPPDPRVVAVVASHDVDPTWRPVLPARLPDGTAVVVAHADAAELASVAVLDAVLNNTDRKGSHLLRDDDGRLWGIDHGVSLHAQDKLRTILWGWEGDPLPAPDVQRLRRLRDVLDQPGTRGLTARLRAHLTPAEIDALHLRVDRLLTTGVFPSPAPDWHAIPWPPL